MGKTDSDGCFPITSWTLISRLRSDDEATARRALEELCAQYRYPLYCAIRHRGLAHHDAEDALHDFLAKLLRLKVFEAADAQKGRLGTALGRFLVNWHRDHTRRADDVSLDAPPGSADKARYRERRLCRARNPGAHL